jgi:hypothetical protein
MVHLAAISPLFPAFLPLISRCYPPAAVIAANP